MAWYEWILSILLFIVSLGALITIHEAGHLSMAKVFKVYCHEFSIGFGPALLHKRKQGHETYFSIRAVPLGGYVAMYGEEGQEFEEGLQIPEERSLEGVKKWKKAIIVSAGVILNAILALVLIAISNFCFPVISVTTSTNVAPNSIAEQAGMVADDNIQFIYPASCVKDDKISPIYYEYTTEDKVIHAGNFFIVDTNIEMIPESDPGNMHHYVLTFMYTGNKNDSVFTEGIKLYPAISKADLSQNQYVNEVFKDWAKEEDSPEYYPNFSNASYTPSEKTKFVTSIIFHPKDDYEHFYQRTVEITTEASGNKYVYKNIGLSFKTKDQWLPIGDRFKQTFVDFGDASSAVFKGIGVLFTGGIRNMSGIVGIFETSASLFSNYTFATYLYFWGMISINLAIFNLLPFPGLDGWQLLVTAIEGISKKKLPNKFKSIMSFIGLALLFMLMIAIVVMDIVRIAGA